MVSRYTKDSLAQDNKILALGIIVAGGLVELETFAGVVEGEDHASMSVTRREGVEVGGRSHTLAGIGPKARELM